MFYTAPFNVLAIHQFPTLMDVGAQLVTDPEVAIVRQELRESIMLVEPRYVQLPGEPRRLEILEIARGFSTNPRERTR